MTFRNLFLFVFLTLGLGAFSQNVKDAGLWAGGELKMDIGKKLEAQIAPEVRLDENISRVRGFFSDFGISRELNDHLGVEAVYRLGGRREETWYEPRHRISLGLSGKYDFGDVGVALTYRRQWTPVMTSGEDDVDLSSVRRLRGSVKYTGLKDTDLATSLELFSGEPNLEMTDWRWQFSISRELNKRTEVSAGYLIQRDLTNGDMDFVVRLGYSYFLDLDKKRKKKNSAEPVAPVPPTGG